MSSILKVTKSPYWPNHVQIMDDDMDTVEILVTDIPRLIEELNKFVGIV